MFIKVKPKQLVKDFEVDVKLCQTGYCNLKDVEILLKVEYHGHSHWPTDELKAHDNISSEPFGESLPTCFTAGFYL